MSQVLIILSSMVAITLLTYCFVFVFVFLVRRQERKEGKVKEQTIFNIVNE